MECSHLKSSMVQKSLPGPADSILKRKKPHDCEALHAERGATLKLFYKGIGRDNRMFKTSASMQKPFLNPTSGTAQIHMLCIGPEKCSTTTILQEYAA